MASQGRVEVFYSGTWGRVCYDFWDLSDANVVCSQLGFERALSATSSVSFGRGKGHFWMDHVNCTGNESSLTECEHSAGPLKYCRRNKLAGVVCRTGKVKLQFNQKMLLITMLNLKKELERVSLILVLFYFSFSSFS